MTLGKESWWLVLSWVGEEVEFWWMRKKGKSMRYIEVGIYSRKAVGFDEGQGERRAGIHIYLIPLRTVCCYEKEVSGCFHYYKDDDVRPFLRIAICPLHSVSFSTMFSVSSGTAEWLPLSSQTAIKVRK